MSTDNFSNFIESLTSQQETFEVELINSLGNIDKFRYPHLTLKQFFQFVECADDKFDVKFNVLINSLMNSFSLDLKRPLNLFDKILFILQLRSNSISSNIEYTYNNSIVSVDLNDVINNIKNQIIANKHLLQPQQININNFEFVYGPPLLEMETQVYKEVYGDQNLSEMAVGKIITNEIGTCLINLNCNVSADFNKFNAQERATIVENLPIKVTDVLIKHIREIKFLIKQGLTVQDMEIPLDADLFLVN